MSETIDAEECAELLRCTPTQVEELARSGEIPGLKLGRSWLFVKGDLLAYLAEKARKEAETRRARRQPGVTQLVTKQRRKTPPPLPVPA